MRVCVSIKMASITLSRRAVRWAGMDLGGLVGVVALIAIRATR